MLAATYIVVSLFLAALWFVNAAPSLNLPLVPELLSGALSIGLLLLASSRWGGVSLRQVWRSRIARTCVMATASLTALTLVRAGLTLWGSPTFANSCGQMLGWVQQLECLTQADPRLTPAVRTATTLLAAIALFTGSYALSWGRGALVVPRAILTVGLAYVGVTLWGYFNGISTVMPTWVFGSYFGLERMTMLMENPSWVWPYLVPLTLLLTYLLFYDATFIKVPAALVLGATAYLLLKTQQRGAWLLCLALAGAILSGVFVRWLWVRAKSGTVRALIVSGALVITGGSVALFFSGAYKVAIVALGFGADRIKGSSVYSDERLRMWAVAWDGIKEHIWVGHGYGTWIRDFSDLAASHGFQLVLDTAHNFFVQTLFELGALQGLLICATFVAWMICAIALSAHRLRAAYMLFLAMAAWTPTLLVQEVDFIRSTFFVHALFAGWLFGGGSSKSNGLLSGGEAPLAQNDAAPWVVSPGMWVVRILGVLAAVGFLAAGAVGLRVFSLAGFQYEADAKHGFEPKVRWLRPMGTMSYVLPERVGQFAVYEIAATRTPSYGYRDSRNGSNEGRILAGSGINYLPVRIRSLGERPDLYQAPQYSYDNGRNITIMLKWPPVFTSMPLTWSSGLYDWESIPGFTGGVRWCGQTCDLKLADCPAGELRVLTLASMRPDLGAGPVDVTIAGSGEHKFTHEGESFDLVVKDYNSVHITVSRIFSPPHDARELGIMVTGSACRQAR